MWEQVEAAVKKITNHMFSSTILKKVISDPKILHYCDIFAYACALIAAMWTTFNFTQRAPFRKDVAEMLVYAMMAVWQFHYGWENEMGIGETGLIVISMIVAAIVVSGCLIFRLVQCAMPFDTPESEVGKDS
ncbi:uncharacterized protein MYCFIDRAFT_192676 [Pseudocercospora fijiensis CIRAD86]|uniref:Uncharacterized protein n=1 Tax=Pseudocercospora fijiensis (strain CIRAD86) TaxID=383855 RepID=N1Q7B6_PSEFD|nr:uncharacterized protein MYCFIDRAFT_192676 [Pseudocercospora fijiensis CIRAD86]EME88529.1 hypothetical protein MYCFIDRAFT_192676 [Pseudocercospora fijiensis CIRAD86]